jgi:hypothetical protein
VAKRSLSLRFKKKKKGKKELVVGMKKMSRIHWKARIFREGACDWRHYIALSSLEGSGKFFVKDLALSLGRDKY